MFVWVEEHGVSNQSYKNTLVNGRPSLFIIQIDSNNMMLVELDHYTHIYILISGIVIHIILSNISMIKY